MFGTPITPACQEMVPTVRKRDRACRWGYVIRFHANPLFLEFPKKSIFECTSAPPPFRFSQRFFDKSKARSRCLQNSPFGATKERSGPHMVGYHGERTRHSASTKARSTRPSTSTSFSTFLSSSGVDRVKGCLGIKNSQQSSWG